MSTGYVCPCCGSSLPTTPNVSPVAATDEPVGTLEIGCDGAFDLMPNRAEIRKLKPSTGSILMKVYKAAPASTNVASVDETRMRQYEHVGSGLTLDRCPCGYCEKTRSMIAAPTPSTPAPVECGHCNQRWNLQGGGHCTDCGAPVGNSADWVSPSTPAPVATYVFPNSLNSRPYVVLHKDAPNLPDGTLLYAPQGHCQ